MRTPQQERRAEQVYILAAQMRSWARTLTMNGKRPNSVEIVHRARRRVANLTATELALIDAIVRQAIKETTL
jgi:hypothetical protein